MTRLMQILTAALCLSSGLLLNCQLDNSDTPAETMFVNLLGHQAFPPVVITPPGNITAGEQHTCAILESGNVRCWGQAERGQLGYGGFRPIGDTENPSTAGDVDIGNTVIQLTSGTTHTCALLTTGAVRCWGSSSNGQLGYGNKITYGKSLSRLPSTAGDVNVGETVTHVAAGGQHTCALLSTGAVRCWGRGDNGQLGYGNINDVGDGSDIGVGPDAKFPSAAGDVSVGGDVIQIAAGYLYTCALLKSGSVRCWGLNDSGQLGYGNTTTIGDDELPSTAGDLVLTGAVTEFGGTVTEISAGTSHTCALLDNGSVRCWGLNDFGQLGYGHTSNIGDTETPASAGDVNVGGIVKQIAAGDQHTCALLETGAVRCWGNGQDGRLGYGNQDSIGDNETPDTAGDINLGTTATSIVAGGAHTCALLHTGGVRCWGNGQEGILGNNRQIIGDDEVPALAGDLQLGQTIVQISSGQKHTCGLTNTGTVRCWGYGEFGRLGYVSIEAIGDNEHPELKGNVNIGETVKSIGAGREHSCAVLTSGAVRCWGRGFAGALGYGDEVNIGDTETPASVGSLNVGGTVKQISGGDYFTCALLDSGNVRCWGRGSTGQLGYGNKDEIGSGGGAADLPSADVNAGGTVTQITTGSKHTCALLDSGAVHCWGNGSKGQLGNGGTTDIGDDELASTVVDMGVAHKAIQIAAGESHTCAVLETGAVRCWGNGQYGRLGYGNETNVLAPSAAGAGDVNVGGSVKKIAAGDYHTCALLNTGAVRCWGRGSTGQLGYGNTSNIGDSSTPAGAGNVNVGGTVIDITAGQYHTCALLSAGTVRCWGDSEAGYLGYNRYNFGDNETPADVPDVFIGERVRVTTETEDDTE